MATLMYKIANEEHPDPCAISTDLPPEVGEVIHQGLEKDPEKRFQTGGEMALALRACLQAIGTSTPG